MLADEQVVDLDPVEVPVVRERGLVARIVAREPWGPRARVVAIEIDVVIEREGPVEPLGFVRTVALARHRPPRVDAAEAAAWYRRAAEQGVAEAEHNLALLTDGSDGPNWLVSLVLVVLAWGGARILGEYAPQIAEWVDRGPAWLVFASTHRRWYSLPLMPRGSRTRSLATRACRRRGREQIPRFLRNGGLGEYAPQLLSGWIEGSRASANVVAVAHAWFFLTKLLDCDRGARLSDNPRVVFPILVNQVVTFLCLIVAVGLAFFLNRPLLGLLSYFVFVWLGTRVGSDADAPADAN